MLDVVLEASDAGSEVGLFFSFNPCCAGCSSGSLPTERKYQNRHSFNPCCAGCSSGRSDSRPEDHQWT